MSNAKQPDLSVTFAGIHSPNPFWLSSGPPTNTAGQVMRAFDAGWGGAVWKTIGAQVRNTTSRYSAVNLGRQRMMGFSNIELISDRPVEDNLREIREVKKKYSKNALIVSLMVESKREAWHDIVRRAEDAGANGVELNFGCPHGMNERGMGSAVGQVPEYTEMITAWAKEAARVPVLVKLTPNVTDIRATARAAKQGGADAISAINTINSITGIDLDTLAPRPIVDGRSTHGGYCGPAVKPIALNMVGECVKETGLPVSGIGGVSNWRDAAEFMLLGCGTVQVCTAAMHYGFGIVEGMKNKLAEWMQAKGYTSIEDFRGRTLDRVTDWGSLNLDYEIVARINPQTCIGCGLCVTACNDGAYQCIYTDRAPDGFAGPENSVPLAKVPRVDEVACVGCNLCALVCPVDDCIEMVEIKTNPESGWPTQAAFA
jgi:dihydropyrimidine dehydrogenase (NAD+) subunit PreA